MAYDIVNESIMTVLFYDAYKIEANKINSICYFDNKKALVNFGKFDNGNRIVKTYNYPLKKTANYHVSVIAESSDQTYLAYTPAYIYVNLGGEYSMVFVRKIIYLNFIK